MTEPSASGRGERVRAFLAVNFPVPVVRRLAEEIEALRPGAASAGLRIAWVPAANLHLTLKFFGMIPAAAAEAIATRLAAGLAGRAPFDLEARGLGAFPSEGHPRVIWAGVSPSPPLAALQKEVEAWMEELGFAREARPFHPHVTLGRVNGGGGSLAPLFAERGERSFGGGRVAEIVLYESRTLARGAEYHPLSRVPFGPARPARPI